MFKVLIISAFVAYCNAGGAYGGGYGGGSSLGGSYGGSGLSLGSLGGGYSSGGYAHSGGPIQAAVHTRHSVEVRPVSTPYTQIQPQIIDIDSAELPVVLRFNSRSSRVLVQQTHTPSGPGEVQSTQSEDEPHRLVHEVTKPVIQEVREVITPYRRVIQEIRPVVEEVHTVVAKGESRGLSGGALLGGGLGGASGLVLSGAGLGGGLVSGGSLGLSSGGYGGDLVSSGGLGLSSGGYGGLVSGGAKLLSLGGVSSYGGKGLSLGGGGISVGTAGKAYKS